MREPRIHRAASRDQRLADHLSAKHALPSDLRRASAKQIHLKLLEVENRQELLSLGMVVTESKVDDALRPTFLMVDGGIEPGEPFAHVIENPPLIAALTERADALGVEVFPVGIASFENDPGNIAVTLSNGEMLAA